MTSGGLTSDPSPPNDTNSWTLSFSRTRQIPSFVSEDYPLPVTWPPTSHRQTTIGVLTKCSSCHVLYTTIVTVIYTFSRLIFVNIICAYTKKITGYWRKHTYTGFKTRPLSSSVIIIIVVSINIIIIIINVNSIIIVIIIIYIWFYLTRRLW